MTENSVRDIDFIKQMETLKFEYQIRCSHYKLEYNQEDKQILCAICSKRWLFAGKEGFSKIRTIFIVDDEKDGNTNN